MLLLRKTILKGKPAIIKLEGIGEYSVGITEDGAVYDNVEILTRNIFDLGMLESSSYLSKNSIEELEQITVCNQIGPLMYDSKYIIQYNKSKEEVCKIPKQLFCILKVLSMKRKDKIVLTNDLVLETTSYALLKQMAYDKEFFETRDFVYKDNVLKFFGKLYLIKAFDKLINQVPRYYINANLEDTLVKVIIENKAHAYYEESGYFIVNNLLYKTDNRGSLSILPNKLKGVYY